MRGRMNSNGVHGSTVYSQYCDDVVTIWYTSRQKKHILRNSVIIFVDLTMYYLSDLVLSLWALINTQHMTTG